MAREELPECRATAVIASAASGSCLSSVICVSGLALQQLRRDEGISQKVLDSLRQMRRTMGWSFATTYGEKSTRVDMASPNSVGR